MKQLILSGLMGIAALSAAAAETTMTYTYVDQQLSSWGRNRAQTYDVAIRLCDPSLVGKKITSFRAVLNADEGLEATSVWLSKELAIVKNEAGVKVNVPDTYSKETEVEKTYIMGYDDPVGQLSAVLDTPYEITADGIYVGYTLTVPAVPSGEELSSEMKEPIMVSQCDSDEGMYLHTTKDVLSWTQYGHKNNSAAAIYVTLEGDFVEYELGLESLSKANTAIDKNFSVRAVVANHGAAPVSQIGYSYTIGTETYENTVDLVNPIPTSFYHTATVSFPIASLPETGDYRINLKLTSVNGEANTSKKASGVSDVKVLAYLPVHRPMLEEFTGTWCGWCPRGWLSFRKLEELYGDDVVLVAYHANDPMSFGDFPVGVGGAPTSTLNRCGYLTDPYYGNARKGFGMKQDVLESMETAVPAGIEAEAEWADEQHTKISVKAVSTFYEDKENAGYQVGFLLLNNGLTGTTGEWLQSNYYSKNPSYTGTEFDELAKLPGHFPMVFDDVVVNTSGMMGVEGSLPADVTLGSSYESPFTIDITGNEVIQDKDKLDVVAFILNPDGSILNSVKVHVGGDSGVDSVASASEVASVKYYDLSGRELANPSAGIILKKVTYTDGRTLTIKTTAK